MHITVCCLFASETKTAEGYCKSAKRIQVIWARTITFIRAWQLAISMLAQQILLYLWLQILLDCWMCSNIITVSIKISDRHKARTNIQLTCPTTAISDIRVLVPPSDVTSSPASDLRPEIESSWRPAGGDALALRRACRERCKKKVKNSGLSSHRQPRQCRGGHGPKTVKGAQSDPNYASRLLLDCTGISQNHHPCLLTLPFRTGRCLLFRNLFLILWFRSYSDVIINIIARSECLPGGPKNYSYATGKETTTKHAYCKL